MAVRVGTDPNFLVVGAMKSGTTSLITYLGSHPEIYARRDEVHYFDRHHALGPDWYRTQFDGVTGETAIEGDRHTA